MEEVSNLSQDDVLELIKDFPITPLRNKLVISTNVEDLEDDDVDLTGVGFSPEQYVVASGSHCAGFIPAGQKIYLDLDKMTIEVNNRDDVYNPIKKIQLKPVEVNGRVYGIITEDKIEYLINN